MSWYRYQGRCIGRVLHFLEHYCGLHGAEYARVGGDYVELHNARIATYGWCESFGEADVPAFTFAGEQAGLWMEAQIEKRDAAIEDGLPAVKEGPRIVLSAETIDAFNPEIQRRATLWAAIVAKAEPEFFAVGRTLYVTAGAHCFYWDRAIGAWLRAQMPEGT